MNPPDIDLTSILVNYNTRDLLRPCLDALRASVDAAGASHQIVVVENGSRDGSAEVIHTECAGCDVIVNATNVGFGRANNQALAIARGRYVLLVNTDAFVEHESIGASLRYLDANPTVGVLGVRLVGRDGELQPSCRYFPTPWNEFVSRTGLGRWLPSRPVDDMAWPHDRPRACDWVPGCYYVVRREVVDAVGLFDPRFFLYYEEVDHCRAVKAAGWQVCFFPGTTVVHIGGESAKSDGSLTSAGRQLSGLQIESGLLYHRKHHGLAGVLLTGVLAAIGDGVLAAKALARRRGWPSDFAQHTRATWRAMRQTALGLRPTR